MEQGPVSMQKSSKSSCSDGELTDFRKCGIIKESIPLFLFGGVKVSTGAGKFDLRVGRITRKMCNFLNLNENNDSVLMAA